MEDPSDAFEDLRDRRDLQFLEEEGMFKDVRAPVPKQWVEETRKKYKMPPVFALFDVTDLGVETVSTGYGDGVVTGY